MAQRAEDLDLKRDKEAAIFDAACRIIREKGFHQARIADIAAAAGISYGLVYHYFGSKGDLFDALMDQWFRGIEQLLDRLAGESRPVEEKLRELAEFHFEEYQQRPDLVHLFITEFSRATANLTSDRLSRIKATISKTEEIIAQGQAAGAFRKDIKARYLAYFFLGSLESILSSMVLESQPLKSNELKRRLSTSVLTMFLEGARTAELERPADCGTP